VLGLVGPVTALIRHRDLLRVLIKRDIAVRTSGTLLGGLWVLAQPALQILALWFLLDFVLKVRFPGRVPFVSYFLLGMLPWLFISEVMTRTLSLMSELGALYQRSAFPVEVLPLLPLAVSGAVYGIIFIVVAGLLQGPYAALSAAAISLGLVIWLLPVCYLLAVLGLFLSDVRALFPFVLTLTMYLTPIMYMPEMLPGFLRKAMILNPFADLIAVMHGVLEGLPVTAGNLVRPFALWVMLLAPAWIIFRRTEPHMREVL
jgi:lipopolysaccharide transport system permease protein